MLESSDTPVDLFDQFPTELIIYIFKFLSATNLVACRRVCRRWKEVIDNVISDESLWEEHCKRDFKTLSQDARKKSPSLRLWYDIYRSLTLWNRLGDATEVRDEFCHSSVLIYEIQDMTLLRDGVLLVHKRESVVYYNVSTYEPLDRSPVLGEFTRYVEYDHAIVILGFALHLRIIKKPKESDTDTGKKNECVYRHIKHFLMFGTKIYFIHFSNAVHIIDIEKELKAIILPRTYDDTVLTVSLYNGSLHILTAERSVYIYENDTFRHLFFLDKVKDNLFDFLWRYQFMENIDWHIFYIWVTNLHITLPDGPLKYISIMKVYGNTFFVGCRNGVVLIYSNPFTDGKLDLINHKPIKNYFFAEREDIPVLSLHPILRIEIIEIKDGHKVLFAMPKKIIVMTYTNSFEVMTSKAVMPYIPPGPIVVA